MPVAFGACHCIPVRSTNRMASMAALSGTLGLWHPSGCSGRGGNRGSIFAHSSCGILQPSSLFATPIVHFLLHYVTHQVGPFLPYRDRHLERVSVGDSDT